MNKYLFLVIVMLFLNSCIKETTIIYKTNDEGKDMALNGLWKKTNAEYYLFDNKEDLFIQYTDDGFRKTKDMSAFFVEKGKIYSNNLNVDYQIIGDSLALSSNKMPYFGLKRADIKLIENWGK